MPQFNVLATNHTSFTVSDLDRTVAFFRDALGFEVTSKAPRDPDAIEEAVKGSSLTITHWPSGTTSIAASSVRDGET